MSSVVAGLNSMVAAQIEGLGASVIFVRPGVPGERLSPEEMRRRRGLTLDEVAALGECCPALAEFTPMQIYSPGVIQYGRERVRDAQVLGVTETYESVHDTYVSLGRFFNEAEVRRRSAVVVIGADVADVLFPHVDPIGKELRLGAERFQVIGVMERVGSFLFINRDNLILVPLGTLASVGGPFNFVVADARPVSTDKVEDAVGQVTQELRRQRRLRAWEPDNFGIFTQDALTDLYRQITGGIYAVMIAISSIGLVVGGVGVMNIMLVSVTERTREIGVRRALGARRRDLMWQFLTEAMTLTAVGGVLGVAVGGGVAALVNAFSPFPARLQPVWVVAAIATSLGVGLVFGLWPARRASRIDPIEALRYE
jgi:putative ABC transport system permease protein